MSTVRVYVNGRGVDAPADGTALDAVRLADPAAAEDVATGRRGLTDSRGLATTADAPLHNGAIFRLVSARAAGAGSAGGSDVEDDH